MHCVFAIALIASTLVASQIPGYSFGVANRDAAFDYVVVGGGTAGLTIAARLAEGTSDRVAIVEAGGFYEVDNGNLSVVPAYAFKESPRIPTINRPRGTIGSFQKWANAVGDDSYTFDNILPYYQKSVTFTPPNLSKRFTNTTLNYDLSAFDNSLHGPLQVSYANWASPFVSWVQKGLSAVGIQPNDGFNSGNLLGSMWASSTINPAGEVRSSSQTAFLNHEVQNSSLQVYPRTLAKRILFNKRKKATGVVVTSNNSTYTLSARKEIVLSAGAFQSPQLLMVSGIGPADILKQYNIPVIANLPGVGQNFWDSFVFATSYRVNVVTDSQIGQNAAYTAQVIASYIDNQTGPLCSAVNYAGYEKLPYRSSFSASTNASLADFPADWPEVAYAPSDRYTGLTVGDGFNYGGVGTALLAPLSRGNVTIQSADASVPPLINPNFLSHPTDAQVAIAAFKRTRQIFDQLGEITIGPEATPGPAVQTDEQILAFVKQSGAELYHAAGTCGMGKPDDEGAVLDSRARVLGGVGRLRVVDASAFPFLPPNLPQATVYMLAEKIADDMKKGRREPF